MAIQISRHFDVTLTQGSADAFVQASIATELLPSDGLAYVITRAELQVPAIISGGNASSLEWSIARDTKTAICTMDDPDCLYYDAIGWRFTTSGASLQDLRKEVVFPNGIFIVEPYIYCQLDSTSTTLTNSMKMRLWYEQQKLSEVEILRLLNNV